MDSDHEKVLSNLKRQRLLDSRKSNPSGDGSHPRVLSGESISRRVASKSEATVQYPYSSVWPELCALTAQVAGTQENGNVDVIFAKKLNVFIWYNIDK